ncbi:MAG: hypothetical protein N3A54_06495, partial [Patescibacteria group bacterium]|nr:hypothetical protein [Patescibacteria group bacterium]
MSNWRSWAASRDMTSILRKENGSWSLLGESDFALLNASGKSEAVVWIDKREKGRGSHYALIVRKSDGKWYDYDNNRVKMQEVNTSRYKTYG